MARELFPWERHTGCPTCKAKPREVCVIVKTRYVSWEKKLISKGKRGIPTSPHKARYELYCYLFHHGQPMCRGSGCQL